MRRGECQKLFGAVVFQVGHHPVQVTDESDQKGAVLLFCKRDRADGGPVCLLQCVREWEQLNEGVNEWMGDWVKDESR